MNKQILLLFNCQTRGVWVDGYPLSATRVNSTTVPVEYLKLHCCCIDSIASINKAKTTATALKSFGRPHHWMESSMFRLDYESIPLINNGGYAARSDSSSSLWQGSSNLIKVILGAGMFYLPYACHSMGWSAILMIVFFGVITLYSMSLIAECTEAILFDKPFLSAISFADLGQAAFGHSGRTLCSISIMVEFTLAAVSMLINIAVNIHTIVPSMNIPSGIILASGLTYISCQVNNLSHFAYLSACGNLMVVASVAILIIAGLQFEQSGAHNIQHKYVDVSGIPSSLGLIAFCYGGVGAYPKIYISLENRLDNAKMLTVSGLFIIGTYTSVALIGYYFYGDSTKIPVTSNIGLDLNGVDLPWGLFERSIAALGVALNMQVTLPLILFTLRDIIVPSSIGANTANALKNTASLVLVFICMCIALLFHTHFSALCSLVGAACTAVNSVCLPIIFHRRVFHDSLSWRRARLHDLVLIIVVVSSCIGIASNFCNVLGREGGFCSYVAAH